AKYNAAVALFGAVTADRQPLSLTTSRVCRGLNGPMAQRHPSLFQHARQERVARLIVFKGVDNDAIGRVYHWTVALNSDGERQEIAFLSAVGIANSGNSHDQRPRCRSLRRPVREAGISEPPRLAREPPLSAQKACEHFVDSGHELRPRDWHCALRSSGSSLK